MFHSFFPNPRLFFGSFIVWASACVVFWFAGGRELVDWLSFGGLFGYGVPEPLAADADDAAKAAFAAAQKDAIQVWFYQYLVFCYVAFTVFYGGPLQVPHFLGLGLDRLRLRGRCCQRLGGHVLPAPTDLGGHDLWFWLLVGHGLWSLLLRCAGHCARL